MTEKAILKIRTEMNQNTNQPYIQVVGEFLLQHLENNPKSAEKILNPDKTIAKSLDEMQKEAQKKQVGNCAVLTDQEGFTIVLKYFGVETSGPLDYTPPTPSRPAAKANTDFDVQLEDLL